MAEVAKKIITTRENELELDRSITEKCLKATVFGIYMVRAIHEYNDLSYNDFNQLVARARAEANDLTGNNINELKGHLEALRDRVRADQNTSPLPNSEIVK